MQKSFQITVYFTIFLMFVVLGYFAYLTLYPFKTLDVKSTTILTPIVKAGDVLMYRVDYCKHTDKSATVFRTLHSVDETRLVPFPSVSTVTLLGCHSADIPLQTFSSIPPGEYYLLIDAVFELTSQRTIHKIIKTDTFTIK